MTELNMTAALFIMVAHGLVSPVLFVLAGQAYDRQSTGFMAYLGSLATGMPSWHTLLFLATLANAAMPLFPDFIAELVTLQALF